MSCILDMLYHVIVVFMYLYVSYIMRVLSQWAPHLAGGYTSLVERLSSTGKLTNLETNTFCNIADSHK